MEGDSDNDSVKSAVTEVEGQNNKVVKDPTKTKQIKKVKFMGKDGPVIEALMSTTGKGRKYEDRDTLSYAPADLRKFGNLK